MPRLRTYRLRIFVNLISVVALTTIILTTVIFTWLQKKAIKDVQRAQLITLQSISNMFSAYIESYELSAREAFSSKYAPILLQDTEKDWFEYASSYSRQLNTILANNVNINSIELFSENGFFLKTQREAMSDETYSTLLKTILNEKQNLILMRSYHMVYNYPIPMINIISGEYNKEGTCWSRGVVLGIDVSSLAKVLLQGGDDSLMILDRKGRLMMGNDMSLFGASMLKTPYLSEILSSEEEHQTFFRTVDNTKRLYSSVKDPRGRYFIITIHPNKELLTFQTTGLNILLCVGALVFAVALIISIFLSRRMAKPFTDFIDDLLNLMPNSHHDAGLDQLDQARTALRRTRDTIKNLESSNRQEQQILYLLGQETELGEKELFPIKAPITLAVIDIEGEGFFSVADEETQIMTNKIEMILMDEGIHAPLSVIPMNKNRLTLIIGGEEILTEKIERIHKALMTSLNTPLSLGVSNLPRGGKTALPFLYKQAYARLRYRLLWGPSICVTAHHEDSLKKGDFPGGIVEDINKAIKNGEREKTNELLENLLDSASEYDFDTAMDSICILISEIIDSVNILSRNAIGNRNFYVNIYRTLSLCQDREELYHTLWSLLRRCLYEVNIAKEFRNESLMGNIIEFINDNYTSSGLSVQMISDHFHISSSHFSRLFKKNMNCSFPAYVNEKRLNHACSLLNGNKDLSVREISGIVGFDNCSYFIAKFKKKFAVSPQKIRNISLSREYSDLNERGYNHE